MQRRTYYFTGYVQGVGFRFTAQNAAAGHRVTGFVRNLADGRVELVLEGEAAEMNGVLARINAELGENINDTTFETSPATGEFRGFDIRH
jgi:acylphosphatase